MHTNSRQSSGVARIQRRWGKGVVLASRFRCLLKAKPAKPGDIYSTTKIHLST